jgi:hypothetical protein
MAYGIQSFGAGVPASMDFFIEPTGGAMINKFNCNKDIGVLVSLGGSTFSPQTNFTQSWSAASASGQVGVVPYAEAGVGVSELGFWTKNTCSWPDGCAPDSTGSCVNSCSFTLTIGSNSYTKAQLVGILGEATGGDKTIVLAKQQIVAKLNILAGNASDCIDSTISAADAWLTQYAPGSGMRNCWVGQGDTYEDTLTSYNAGQLCVDRARQ